jgi:hypothetical protein
MGATKRAHRPEDIAKRSPMWAHYADLFRIHGRRIRVFADRSLLPIQEGILREALESSLRDVDPRYLEPKPAEDFGDE